MRINKKLILEFLYYSDKYDTTNVEYIKSWHCYQIDEIFVNYKRSHSSRESWLTIKNNNYLEFLEIRKFKEFLDDTN